MTYPLKLLPERLRRLPHNCIAHPLSEILRQLGAKRAADWVHDSTVPEWFAYWTQWLDDHSSATAWPQVIRRYAACAARWSALDAAAWRRVEVVARRVAVIEAMRHTGDEQVLDACRGVLVWLDADMPESSRAAVKSAAVSAKEAAVLASRAAERSVEEAAATASASAAWASAWAATWAAEAAVEASAWAADRIVDAVLSALEKECGL